MPWSSNRILFVTWAANLGGIQSSLATRIRALHEFGVRADVLFCHSGNGRESFRGITNYVTRHQRTVTSLVRRKQYRAISFINLVPFAPALRAANFGGKLLYELRGYSERCLQVCATLSPDEFGAIVVPSHYVESLISEEILVPNIPVHVVYNAVDTKLFQPASATHAQASRPILLWIGRLDWNKNFPELLRIVSILRSKELEFDTWVVTDSGVSKGLQDFRKAVADQGLGEYIRLIENVARNEMPSLYRMAAESGGCVLSTSRTEGLQNTLLEGMACGCPVVTSAVGGNVEIVTHGVNGATYPTGRADLAANEVAWMFRNAARRKAFTQSGLEYVTRQHAPRAHAKAFLEVLKQAPRARMKRS